MLCLAETAISVDEKKECMLFVFLCIFFDFFLATYFFFLLYLAQRKKNCKKEAY
jgi:hypothetical protein